MSRRHRGDRPVGTQRDADRAVDPASPSSAHRRASQATGHRDRPARRKPAGAGCWTPVARDCARARRIAGSWSVRPGPGSSPQLPAHPSPRLAQLGFAPCRFRSTVRAGRWRSGFRHRNWGSIFLRRGSWIPVEGEGFSCSPDHVAFDDTHRGRRATDARL